MSSTSPFNIPHIVNSVCDYLNLNDVVNCKKVCKDWNDVFAPHEWRSLHLANCYDCYEQWSPSPEKRTLILKHAHRIESLTIHQDATWLPESSCVNLKHLAYVHGSFFQDPYSVYLSTNNLMVQDLSHLTELRLCYPGEDYHQPEETTINPVVLAMALSNCPTRLESLHVLYYFPWSNSTEPHVPRNDPSTFNLPWEPLPLHKFHFTCDYSCSFKGLIDIGLIPFLRNCCPLLEDLSLPSFPEEACETLMKTIGAHCPKLKYLRLNSDSTADCQFGFEVDHFGCVTQPLKFLKIDLQYRHDTVVLETLKRNGSDALETLEFMNTSYYFSEYIPPYNWFPNLKTVHYHRSHRGSTGMEMWTRPLEPTENDDKHREHVREEYTIMVNM
ncbi:MAG: hypothetical protein BYD32DRAFT_419361 [Podila humilis]|nr:MAG: hypothetical protein BYD32DRAFT_419361 [Podila humilis]